MKHNISNFLQSNQIEQAVPKLAQPSSILDRVVALEQNAQQNDASLTKVIEELYMRIGQLEQLVRG